MNVKQTQTKASKKGYQKIGSDFFVEFWEESWTYIKTVVDVLREPVLILDKDLQVLAANEAFYSLFKVTKAETEGTIIFKLGNGQWDIPALRSLLEDIIPEKTFFKGFEVEHKFPIIGTRTIILNARHIYSKDKSSSELFPPIIMLAMDDVTTIMSIAKTLAEHTSHLEKTLAVQSTKLEAEVTRLDKKINVLAKK